MTSVRSDRLRDLLDTVLGALDDGLDGEALARRVSLSRFHFDRLLASGLGEAPASFRRRLLLERAAWQLGQGARVTEAGIEAGYGSTEAFSRAFSRAFRVTRSEFAHEQCDFGSRRRTGFTSILRRGCAWSGERGERGWI